MYHYDTIYNEEIVIVVFQNKRSSSTLLKSERIMMMCLEGWIIYNGHLTGNKFRDFAEWIQNAGDRKGIKTKIIKNNHLFSILSDNSSRLLNTSEQSLPDFVVFGDKDIPLARQLEDMQIPVFNSAQAISTCDNKIETYRELSNNKLAIPKTIVAPKIFPGLTQIEQEPFQHVASELGFPLIIKEAYGSFGEQVYLITSFKEMLTKVMELKEVPYVFQQFVSTSFGKDVRINVVGDNVVAAMLRTSKEDFRANVSAGGQMEPYQPSQKEKEIAIAATRAVGADFAGVDLLFGENKEPIVCEVNSNAHIRNIYDCTGVNVADFIMNHIVNEVE
ncbi:RimK family alpha-L-glutamate ligase [Terrihalobacillus insolitus]